MSEENKPNGNKSFESRLWVDTLYGGEVRKGLVQLSFGDTSAQFTPDEAREVANHLLQAAEVAEQEDVMVRFIEEVHNEKLTTEEIGVLLLRFRALRHENDSGE
jgi:hypothetical protein